MLYRALRRLSIGVENGGLFDGARLKDGARNILENKHFIQPVTAPPIRDVWPDRVSDLFEAGFNCLTELVLSGDLPEKFVMWREEAIKLLTPGPYQAQNQCGCNRRK